MKSEGDLVMKLRKVGLLCYRFISCCCIYTTVDVDNLII